MTNTIASPTLEELNNLINVLEISKTNLSHKKGRFKTELAESFNDEYLRTLDIELYCLYAARENIFHALRIKAMTGLGNQT